MNTVHKVLIGTAVVQTALLAVMWMPRGGETTEPRDLLGIPTDQIQSITIHGRETREEKAPSKPVVLTHTDAGWVLTSSQDYPASDTYVKPLLESLGKLKAKTPIATQEASFAGLEVADVVHTRLLEVTGKDGTTRKLYVGAAQGQVAHVRVAGESEVFDVKGVSAWALAENDNRYFERDLLKVSPDDVTTVSLTRPGTPTVTFAKDAAGTWTISGYGDGTVPADQAETTSFLTSLLTLRMLQPEGKEIKPEMGFDQGFRVTWTQLENGAPVQHEYQLGAVIPIAEGRRWMKLDSSPFVFSMNKGSIATAVDKPLDPLLDQPVDLLPTGP